MKPVITKRRAYNKPIPWLPFEEEALERYLNKELDFGELQGLLVNRTKEAIKNKIRKTKIRNDDFGKEYRDKKILFTIEVAKEFSPKVVFDGYAGAGHQSLAWFNSADTVFACEISKSKYDLLCENLGENGFEKQYCSYNNWERFRHGEKVIYTYRGDAIQAAAYIPVYDIKVDLLDLDTCGSTILSLPTYLNMIKPKLLCVTHGEFHSFRFQRQDVLKRILVHKNIIDDEGMTLKDFEKELDKAIKCSAYRAHDDVSKSFSLEKRMGTKLGGDVNYLLRNLYEVTKPKSSAGILNALIYE